MLIAIGFLFLFVAAFIVGVKSLIIKPTRIVAGSLLLVFMGNARAAHDNAWSTYGGNLEGQHYSSLRQITPENVSRLRKVWTFHTGALQKPGSLNRLAAFESNPVIWGRTLYLDTPFDAVIALDAATGAKRWSYDPMIDRNATRSIVTSRGVALWHSVGAATGACRDRVFVATLDARLIALDAGDGKPCEGFGDSGKVDLTSGVALREGDDYEMTSAATVVGNTVVVGSSIGDNRAVEEEFGIVRGFDVVTGRMLWKWDPIPWAAGEHPRTGAGNAWSAISADAAHGLVYVPTGSASPDFFGGYRPGDNRDADSVVALEARTGKRIWGFQVVHHDLWDYDVAAEPTLFTFRGKTPAVAISTKMGMVFVLNRLTGQPLYPVEERPVPQLPQSGADTPRSSGNDASGWRRVVARLRYGFLWVAAKLGLVSPLVPGGPKEQLSPTQPFSSLPPLAPLTFSAAEVFGKNAAEKQFCRDELQTLVNQGIYTPVSLKNTLLYPGSVGGVNWGSAALDPATGVMYVNTNRLAFITRLAPRPGRRTLWDRVKSAWGRWTAKKQAGTPAAGRFGAPDTAGQELSAQAGTPYMIFRAPLLSPSGFAMHAAAVGRDGGSGSEYRQEALGAALGNAAAGG